MKKHKKKRSDYSSVLITKVIVLNSDSPIIVGSGYLIQKADGMVRLDIIDLNGDGLPDEVYGISKTNWERIGFTSDRIQ